MVYEVDVAYTEYISRCHVIWINIPRMDEIGTTIPKCQFIGARCATTHDKPSLPAQFACLIEN